jgi:hypothetical protein
MRRLHVAIAALALCSSAATPVLAQEPSLTSGVLSLLGITAPESPSIDYRERPPLVVPPRSSLPSPQEQAARARTNWPNDPDLQRRRTNTADALTPATEREKYRLNQNGRLSNEDLARGRGGANTRVRIASPSDNDPDELLYAPMRQMREADARNAARAKDNEVPLGQEPPRRYLFEPPTGMRTTTQRIAPGPQAPVIRSESTGQREFVTGQPLPQ